jgi:hypothetical protein
MGATSRQVPGAGEELGRSERRLDLREEVSPVGIAGDPLPLERRVEPDVDVEVTGLLVEVEEARDPRENEPRLRSRNCGSARSSARSGSRRLRSSAVACRIRRA